MQPVYILLADDDEDDRMFFKQALSQSKTNIHLDEVEDGQQLTEYIAKIESPPPPDVIFLDINMPYKNGKECLQVIRANKKFISVPIIMFSTSTRLKDIEDTFADGANMYVPKSVFYKHDFSFLDKRFSPNWRSDLLNVSREQFLMKT
ncbi:hypothetical protein BH09BAC1_BH09BAC1_00510 [soil metagenome]